ncbi:DnaD domain-containing protein [Megasphaera stantonii]|uniref:DnaD domain-containing protein n=1 Tax=Megasphaera stantonii TaxID=2144175 RepID=UPI001D214DA7|nr:DnaD domain protein [Megasphaera stantonii]HJE82934.1 DnaD domain protein [Megasphaera stantonii]
MQCYQKNIRPICSEIESQKLYDLVERYGKDAVLKAIERAVLRGGRTLSYINGILLSWEQHGYDEEAEHGNEDRTNAARRRNGKPVRRENSAVKGGVRTDWSDVPDGWV